MPNSSDLELRRQLEEPSNQEYRPYPLRDKGMLVTMLDTPYYPPLIAGASHYHNCLEIGLCMSGSGFVRLREKFYSFSPGSIIVAPKGVHHNQEYNDDSSMVYWRYLVINDEYLLRHLPERYQGRITAFFDSIRDSGLFLESSPQGAMESLIQLMFDLRRRDGGQSSQELELCLLLFLQLIASHAESTPFSTAVESIDAQARQPIEPALVYVYEHYKEDIQINTLARACSMSESYFRKQFARFMGQSPLEYVNAYRIHRSMNLLRTTSDSIQNIAARSGFSSIAAFNRNFRQHAGMSPSKWRQAKITCKGG